MTSYYHGTSLRQLTIALPDPINTDVLTSEQIMKFVEEDGGNAGVSFPCCATQVGDIRS